MGGAMREIPVLDLRRDGLESLAHQRPDLAHELLAAGRGHLGAMPLAVLDHLSAAWAKRSDNPHHQAATDLAECFPPGIWFMNFCYEWGCTTGTSPDPCGQGARLRRTLDWPFPAIGSTLVVAHANGPAGDFHAVTWPGYLGVITGMASGRFAIAINQAPLPLRLGRTLPVNWIIQRAGVWRSRALPPAQLLRRVFETAPDFQAARAMLRDTPIALPAIFTIAGTRPDELCMIERKEDAALLHDGPQAAANHWIGWNQPARDRGNRSQDRRAAMLSLLNAPSGPFDWVAPPILNKDTRLAMTANAATEQLSLRGYEGEKPVTADFHL